jgi:hypothetical protein
LRFAAAPSTATLVVAKQQQQQQNLAVWLLALLESMLCCKKSVCIFSQRVYHFVYSTLTVGTQLALDLLLLGYFCCFVAGAMLYALCTLLCM